MKTPKTYKWPIWLKILEWAWLDGCIAILISAAGSIFSPAFAPALIISLSFTLSMFIIWLGAIYIISEP
jgi:hypothetical protein